MKETSQSNVSKNRPSPGFEFKRTILYRKIKDASSWGWFDLRVLDLIQTHCANATDQKNLILVYCALCRLAGQHRKSQGDGRIALKRGIYESVQAAAAISEATVMKYLPILAKLELVDYWSERGKAGSHFALLQFQPKAGDHYKALMEEAGLKIAEPEEKQSKPKADTGIDSIAASIKRYYQKHVLVEEVTFTAKQERDFLKAAKMLKGYMAKGRLTKYIEGADVKDYIRVLFHALDDKWGAKFGTGNICSTYTFNDTIPKYLSDKFEK